MLQAAEAMEFDDIGGDLDVILAETRLVPADAGQNVVRPFFPAKPVAAPSHQKPELSAALDAVVRAADFIKAAQERADRAEERFRDLETRSAAALGEADARTDAERQRADDAEARVMAVTERAAERLSNAQDELRVARDEIRRLADEADAAERRHADERAELEARVAHGADRVFAAETRALEVQEDLSYLETYIRERFPS